MVLFSKTAFAALLLQACIVGPLAAVNGDVYSTEPLSLQDENSIDAKIQRALIEQRKQFSAQQKENTDQQREFQLALQNTVEAQQDNIQAMQRELDALKAGGSGRACSTADRRLNGSKGGKKGSHAGDTAICWNNDGAGIESFVDIEESSGEFLSSPGPLFLFTVLPEIIGEIESGSYEDAAGILVDYFLNAGTVGDRYEEYIDVGITNLGVFELKKGEAIMIEATVTSCIYPIGFKDECNVFGPLLDAIDKGINEVLEGTGPVDTSYDGGLLPNAETTDAELFAGIYLMPVLKRTCPPSSSSGEDCTAGETFTAQPSPFVALQAEFELHGDDDVLSGEDANEATPCDPNNLACDLSDRKKNRKLVEEALKSEDRKLRRFKLFDGTPSKSGSTQTSTAKFYFPSADLGKGHYELEMYVVAAAYVDIEHCQGIFGISGSAKGMAGAQLGPHLYEVRKVNAAETECGYTAGNSDDFGFDTTDVDEEYRKPFLTWVGDGR
jgi:hypothetical protein